MNDIVDFNKQYKAQLDEAVAASGMPAELLAQYSFESCIRKDEDGKKELYLLTRNADEAKALLRVTFNYPEEDAIEEARLLETLDHPAIPKVYAAYEQAVRKYSVRAYVEGRSLYEIVKASGTLSTKDIFDVVLKLCDVLDYLHNLKPPVIHRDIKPQNIIVAADGGIHLIDFGIARVHKPGQKQDTSIILSGQYAPPEQYGYDQTSALTDIYALGVVMLFMATAHEEKAGLAEQIKDKTLRRLIERCIAFDPKARFQNIRSIAAYIERNTRKQRNRGRALLALLFAAVAALSAAPSYFLAYRAGENFGREAGYEAGYGLGYETGSGEGKGAGYHSGYVAGIEAGYKQGYEAAPGLGMTETPFDPSIGNWPGNLSASDGGFAARSESEIFYIYGNDIYRMDAATAKAQPMLRGQKATSLSYYEGWLYYSTDLGIYRIDPTTLKTEVFCAAAGGKLFIADGVFYLRNATDDLRLYRIDAGSGAITKMNDLTRYYYPNIAGGRMYFTHHDEGRRLYSCNLDGSDLRLVYDDTCEWICIYEGRIYCFALGENGGYLTRMDMDGGNVERLLRSNVNYINVTPSGIYYTNGNERMLEWMDFDGKTRYAISPHSSGAFNLAGEWIFYINNDDGDTLWRVRIDGTDEQPVAASSE